MRREGANEVIWVMMLSLIYLQMCRCEKEEMKNRCITRSPPPPQMGAMFAAILHPRLHRFTSRTAASLKDLPFCFVFSTRAKEDSGRRAKRC